MKNFILVFVLAFIITGCGSTVKLSQPQVVQVPIEVKCKSTVTVTPIAEYPFDNATKEMTLYEKFQLALAEKDLVRGQNKELTAALSECTDK